VTATAPHAAMSPVSAGRRVLRVMRYLALAVLFVLAGCSTPPEKAPEVASLSTPNSTGSPTSSAAPPPAAAAAERPRERLDMTPEDQEALRAPLNQCLAAQGLDARGMTLNGGGAPTDEVLKAAQKACESKDPLPPWEWDRANPEAVDFASRVVQCLRDKGVKSVEIHDNPAAPRYMISFGGPQNDSESITLGLQYAQECEIQASRKK